MNRNIRIVVAALAFGLLMPAVAARSAEQLKKGDSVEVIYLRSWRPGVVVKPNYRGFVLVEFEFAGGTRQGTFRRNEVRLSSEKHPKESESSEAQPPQPLPVEEFASSGVPGSVSLPMSSSPERTALTPDPVPRYLKLKQGGAGFSMVNHFEAVGAILAVGGPDSWLLVSVEDFSGLNPSVTRLLWISTTRQKVEGRQLLPPGELVLDYLPPCHRLLTYSIFKDAKSELLGKAGTLTLWEVLPTDKAVQPVVRWDIGKYDPAGKPPWARLIDKDIVVQWSRSRELTVWNVAEKKMLYSTLEEAQFPRAPALSGGRKYLFIPEDKRVRILEAATGRAVSVLPAPDMTTAVAPSDDGRRVAVLDNHSLTVWDITDPHAEPRRCNAVAIAAFADTKLWWAGEERVLAETNASPLVLYSIPHELPIWHYELHTHPANRLKGERDYSVVVGHLIYPAADGQRNVLAAGAVALPGPNVEDAVASLDRESLVAIKPGSTIQLDVKPCEHAERIRAALKKKIEANGWKLDPASSNVMLAEMGRGESTEVTFHMFRKGVEQKLTVTPDCASIRIRVDGEPAWMVSTGGISPIVLLREGETPQGEIEKLQKPRVDFFEHIVIPNRIADPRKRLGLGVSKVTMGGLIPEEPEDRREEIRKKVEKKRGWP
jgi:hypothetical protein